MRQASFKSSNNEAVKNPWLGTNKSTYLLRILTYYKKKKIFNRAHLCSLLLSSLKVLTQNFSEYFMDC